MMHINISTTNKDLAFSISQTEVIIEGVEFEISEPQYKQGLQGSWFEVIVFIKILFDLTNEPEVIVDYVVKLLEGAVGKISTMLTEKKVEINKEESREESVNTAKLTFYDMNTKRVADCFFEGNLDLNELTNTLKEFFKDG